MPETIAIRMERTPDHKEVVRLTSKMARWYEARYVLRRSDRREGLGEAQDLQIQFFPSKQALSLQRSDFLAYWPDVDSVFPQTCGRLLLQEFAPATPPMVTLQQISMKGSVSWHFTYERASERLIDPIAAALRFLDVLEKAVDAQFQG